MNANAESTTITKRLLPVKERCPTRDRHFPGALDMQIETLTFNALGELCEEYKGGYWEFYELSNGGFYMAPTLTEPVKIRVCEGNQFAGEMSCDAAGIVATLFALSRLAFISQAETVGDHYHALLDYACQHEERKLILSAID